MASLVAPSRFVVPVRPALASGTAPSSGGVERIVKYVPAEIVSIYMLVVQALASLNHEPAQLRTVVISLFVIFFVGTAFYQWRFAPKDVRASHLIVSPLAFAAWAYSITGPLIPSLFSPVYAFAAIGVVLLLSLFVVPK
jgi:hypothetical protein